jgi:RNA polymerase sigma factor (sigma-70 family)
MGLYAGGPSVELHTFDADYVAKLASGDSATESHFGAYFAKFILLKLRARRVAPEMAEEVCQETLLRVLKALRHGSGVSQPERFGAYVNAVSNNVLLELSHKQARHPPIDEDAPEPADDAVDVETAMITDQRKRLVRSILDEMPPKDRDILRMVFFDEADREAIAARFKIEPGYLRVLLHRAKSKFQAAYVRKQGRFGHGISLFILCNASWLKFTIC